MSLPFWRARTPKHTHHRRSVVAAAATTLLATAALAPVAFADHYEATLEGSVFEIDHDANLAVNSPGMLDWANVTQSYRVDKVNGTGDNSYAGGVKEDTECPAEKADSIPPNKSDLLQFGVYEEAGDPGFLHMYWVRVNEPQGTTLMDFEFNQSSTTCGDGPNVIRTENDLLIEYSIVQGGAQAVMTLRHWDGTAWGPADLLTDANLAAGTINASAIGAGSDQLDLDGDGVDDPMPAMSERTFGEASVDLSVIFKDDQCTSFGSAMLKSRSSDSFTSQLKDFAAPVPISLTNCGQVKISKVTTPPDTTTDFDFTKSFGTDPSSDNVFDLKDGETESFSGVLFGEDYTVTEDALPAGWEFDRIDCDASSGVVPTIDSATRTITFTIDDEEDIVDCTYYNKAQADLTIVKQVNDDPGGQNFPFSEDVTVMGTFDLMPLATGAAGAASQEFSGIATGTYNVSETVPTGWNLVSATCDDTNATDLELTSGAITLGAGDDVTCTFVNERERGAIEITKTRKHAADDGGSGPHAGVGFTLTLKDPMSEAEEAWSQTFDATDASGVTCLDGLLYDDYVVTETVPSGYVSDAGADDAKDVTVSLEAACGDEAAAAVAFVNTPLTNITVSVDSQVDGGTASTIVCVDANDMSVAPDETVADSGDGDSSATYEDLLPTDPVATLVCTITVDP